MLPKLSFTNLCISASEMTYIVSVGR